MANINPPETQNSQNPSTSSILPPSSSMGANTGTTHASKIVSSMNTTQSNQYMTAQVARMSEFLGIPQHQRPLPRDWVRENQEPTLEEDLTINQVLQNQGGIVVPPRIEPHVHREPRVLMVNRNQNVDDIIWQVRHDDVAADNNLAAIVERIMVRNGVNFGLRTPDYTSPLAEYVLQTDAPLRTKIPKFTKFVRDTTEYIIEHVARYLIEAGDMSNNENLRMKFFPSSITKNAFTWSQLCPKIRSIHGTS
ncbi:uncharacterized protein LOC127104533 [Lathyrus oleraceus]|uniref:uncharacterized protein LOC127104533 n=1 Tax=Pisum sativum TaxID=3888 RepID=UPI0021D244B5|nr:uncharacterized protein LOC127104533 [Pisum sativum]